MVQSLLAALVLVCCSFSSNAQTTVDLLDPSAGNWSGTYGTGYWGQGRCSSFNCTNGSPNPNRIPNDSGFIWSSGNTSTTCSAVPTFESHTSFSGRLLFTVSSGLTAGQAGAYRAASTDAYLAWSAEL